MCFTQHPSASCLHLASFCMLHPLTCCILHPFAFCSHLCMLLASLHVACILLRVACICFQPPCSTGNPSIANMPWLAAASRTIYATHVVHVSDISFLHSGNVVHQLSPFSPARQHEIVKVHFKVHFKVRDNLHFKVRDKFQSAL